MEECDKESLHNLLYHFILYILSDQFYKHALEIDSVSENKFTVHIIFQIWEVFEID